MKRRLFFAILLFLLFPAFWAVDRGFSLMNQPDDAQLVAGILVLLTVLVLAPSVLGYLYRKIV